MPPPLTQPVVVPLRFRKYLLLRRLGPGGLLAPRSPLISFADQGLASAGNFLTTILIARGLGLEAFGRYTLIWLVLMLAANLQLGLIVSPMMSIGSKYEGEERQAYLGAVVLHEGALCLLAMAGIGLAAWIVLPAAAAAWSVVLAAAFGGGAYLAQDFLRRLFFTQQRPLLVIVSDAINQFLKLSIVGWLWYAGDMRVDDAYYAVGAAALLSVLCTAPLVGPLRFRTGRFRQITVRQWTSARWLALTALLQWAGGNGVLVIAAAVLGPTTIGGLRAGQNILGVLNLFREAMENIVPQYTARVLTTAGDDALRRALLGMMAAILVGGACVVIALSIYGTEIMRIAYGAAYVDYDFVVKWLSFAFITSLMIVVLMCGFRALEQTFPIFAASLVAVGVSLLSVYPAIVAFHLAGVVGVLLLSDLCTLLVLATMLRRLLFKASSSKCLQERLGE